MNTTGNYFGIKNFYPVKAGRQKNFSVKPNQVKVDTTKFAGDKNNPTKIEQAFVKAASKGKIKVMENLLKKNPKLNINARVRNPNVTLKSDETPSRTEYGNYYYGPKIINYYDTIDTALTRAAQNGHTNVVKFLLSKEGIEIDDRSDYSTPNALYWSVRKGHLDIVKELIAAGISLEGTFRNMDYDREYILETAIKHKQPKVIEELLANNIDVNFKERSELRKNVNKINHRARGRKSIFELALESDTQTLETLLKAGLTVSPDKYMLALEHHGPFEHFKTLVTFLQREPLLIKKDAKHLIDKYSYQLRIPLGSNTINKLNFLQNLTDENLYITEAILVDTILKIQNNDIRYSDVTDLLNKNIDINYQTPGGDTFLMCALNTYTKNAGDLPLESVKKKRDFSHKVLPTLLSKKPNLNLKDSKGCNALMYACRSLNLEAVKLLLNENIDINAKNNLGDNALQSLLKVDLKSEEIEAKHFKENFTKIAELLINAGIDLKAKNNKGESSLYLSAKGEHFKIFEMIERKS